MCQHQQCMLTKCRLHACFPVTGVCQTHNSYRLVIHRNSTQELTPSFMPTDHQALSAMSLFILTSQGVAKHALIHAYQGQTCNHSCLPGTKHTFIPYQGPNMHSSLPISAKHASIHACQGPNMHPFTPARDQAEANTLDWQAHLGRADQQ